MPDPRPRAWPEVVGVTLALLVMGTVSALVVPPCQTPDEGYSFLRAYHVADGHPWPEMVGAWGGGRFPPGVLQVVKESVRLVDKPDEKFTPAEWRALATLDGGGVPEATGLLTAAPYTFVPYLPQAAGIRVAREFGCGPLALFYAGRFANLLFGTALVALALALAPVGRRFLGLVALLPMTVHLFGSYAPEVGAIGAGLLVPAVVLRLALADRRAAGWELGVVVLAVAWVGTSKPPYLPVAAFVLAVPAARFGGPFRRWAFVAVAFAVGGAVGLSGVEKTRAFYPDPHTDLGAEVSVKGQTRFVKDHPGHLARLFVEATVVRAVPTYFRLFKLGWLDTTIDPAVVVLYTLVLGLMAAAGRAELTAAGAVPRWPAALAGVGGLGLVVLSLYIWCAPVGSSVASIHGRYLLPLLPAALFLAPGRVPRVFAAVGTQRAVAGWGVAAISTAAFVAVVSRYYLAATPGWLRVLPYLVAVLPAAAYCAARLYTTPIRGAQSGTRSPAWRLRLWPARSGSPSSSSAPGSPGSSRPPAG